MNADLEMNRGDGSLHPPICVFLYSSAARGVVHDRPLQTTETPRLSSPVRHASPRIMTTDGIIPAAGGGRPTVPARDPPLPVSKSPWEASLPCTQRLILLVAQLQAEGRSPQTAGARRSSPVQRASPRKTLLWRQAHPYTWGSKLPLARLEHMCYIPGRGGRLSEMSCPPPSIKGWGFDERRHTRW
jgi:hypothetical protein